jgi:hypothetical protein
MQLPPHGEFSVVLQLIVQNKQRAATIKSDAKKSKNFDAKADLKS